MRVIAGTARGIPLLPPHKSLPIRPTLDRVRESLFSILGTRIEGGRFLDLFAGTGAHGIEALSRGAAEAVFVDGDARALKLVRDNLVKTRLERGAVCLKLRLPAQLPALRGPFAVAFADPPYEFDDYSGLLAGLSEHHLLAEGGLFVLEHARKNSPPEAQGILLRTRQAHYGDTTLSFYEVSAPPL